VGLGDTESLPEGAQVTFLPAGHILGATIIEAGLPHHGVYLS
jgi:Cft2 family RNA processing exonuclease